MELYKSVGFDIQSSQISALYIPGIVIQLCCQITQMAWLSTSRPRQSITLCILATFLSILTTNIFTSCDARLFRAFNTDSWDPTEDLDYINPSDIDTYSGMGSSLAPSASPSGALSEPPYKSIAAQPSAAILPSGPVEPPTTSTSMVSDPPGYAAKPPSHGHRKGHPSHSRFPVWCVARPTVPEPMLQKAMDYACGSGADCNDILPNGSCFVPNSLFSHASYAFNNYWQKTKNSGGTCDFGGTAMLITVDPSFDGCQFDYN